MGKRTFGEARETEGELPSRNFVESLEADVGTPSAASHVLRKTFQRLDMRLPSLRPALCFDNLVNLVFCSPWTVMTNAVTRTLATLRDESERQIVNGTQQDRARARYLPLLETKQRKKKRVRSRSQPWGLP